MLALPSGTRTAVSLQIGGQRLAIERLDVDQAPAVLGFVREPQPLPGEKASR